MSELVEGSDLKVFRCLIASRLGLHFDDAKLPFLAEVLARRVASRRLNPTLYLGALDTQTRTGVELVALARELTVGETYFFRHSGQFRALVDVALPERLAAQGDGQALRMLSAGCASGEEAYSLSMLAREPHVAPRTRVVVQGIDLNPDSLAKAARGLYSAWSLRETPPDIQQRWFSQQGQDFELAASLRESVRFDLQNLMQPDPAVVPASAYDVVFCRNVLMYFTPEHAASIVQSLESALRPGGFLFLGHAETLRGLSHAFHLRHAHDAFFYQRKAGAQATRKPPLGPGSTPEPLTPPPPSTWFGDWSTAIDRSSDRILALTDTRPRANDDASLEEAPSRQGRSNLGEALEHLRHERFAEALEVVQTAPHDANGDPATLLLRAALFTHQGEIAQAEAACRDLLSLDDLNAGAHYLLGLCCERKGASEMATEHARSAAHLDPAFAMPHLHLGLMARRRQDTTLARRELARALLLLPEEEASRVLLFGGGFSREALLALCRSELEALRGA